MSNSKAFTLLEVSVVLAIMGIVMASAFQFMPKQKNDSWKVVLSELNDFISFPRQEAIVKKEIHQLKFYSFEDGNDKIKLAIQVEHPDDIGRKVYKEVTSGIIETVYKFPKTIRINRIFINGKEPEEDLTKGASSYILPDGMMEDLHLQVIRKKDEREERFTLVLSPFIGKFELHEGFIRP